MLARWQLLVTGLVSLGLLVAPVEASDGEQAGPHLTTARASTVTAQRAAADLARARQKRSATDRRETYIVVGFKDRAGAAASSSRIQQAYQLQPAEGSVGKLGVARYRVPSARQEKVIQALRTDPSVQFAEVDERMQAFAVPNDPYLRLYQWAADRIELYRAWDRSIGSPGVAIAVVDSGVDDAHPDLAPRLTGGWNFDPDSLWYNTPLAVDCNSHGTHVAGIAGGVANNWQGITGVTWVNPIMPVRVLGCDGTGYASAVANGIVWAGDRGARIINLSLGGGYSSTLHAAVLYALDRGVLVVAAAGSSADEGNPVQYPAALPGVFAVGATGHADGWAPYSQVQYYVQISAPGGDGLVAHSTWNILSTTPTYDTWLSLFYGAYKNYDWFAGTSMAAPYVAGVAALVWAVRPDLSAEQVKLNLVSGVDDLGARGWDPYFGHGRVNARRSLELAVPPTPTAIPTLTSTPTSTPTPTPSVPPKPAQPSDLTRTVKRLSGNRGTQVTLRWVDNATNETSYLVERRKPGSSPWATRKLKANATSFKQTLTKKGKYYYRVKACNAAGCSAYAGPVSVVVK